jgi:hypothetical protein
MKPYGFTDGDMRLLAGTAAVLHTYIICKLVVGALCLAAF